MNRLVDLIRAERHACPAPEPGKFLVLAGPWVPGGPRRAEGRPDPANDASYCGTHVGGQRHLQAGKQ